MSGNATNPYRNAAVQYPTSTGYSPSSSATAYGMNAAKLNSAAAATQAALTSASNAKGVPYNSLVAAPKATGGAKKTTKTSKTAKPSSAKTAKPSSAKTVKPASKTKSSKSKSKSGGALMEDIKNLAVPFAILLAKQGFDSAFEKKAAAAESKSASSKRRGTMAGGSACASGCGMTGGQSQKQQQRRQPEGQVLQKRFNHIAKEIEDFLNKY